MIKLRLALLIIFFSAHTIIAQNREELIQSHLELNVEELGLINEDIVTWEISDSHIDRRNEIEFVYIQQTVNGIPFKNAIANFAIKNGEVLYSQNRFHSDSQNNLPKSSSTISPELAIISAASQLNIPSPKGLRLIEEISENELLFSDAGISLEDIPVKLMYLSQNDQKFLIWDLSIYEKTAENWWSVSVDAETGKIVEKANWVSKCDFGHLHNDESDQEKLPSNKTKSNVSNKLTGSQYRVFELPVESPSHGPRSLAIEPSDSLSSPFGWHDINGQLGPEFTITRGNNVFAYTDVNNTNLPGFSPDGTSALNFDFPFIAGTAPSTYQPAAVTNLFYMNNKMHDIWYQYGFDEASGNFQVNNYGRGGLQGDEVNAEAQDGSGLNNANFATPPDGVSPRMQMYVWTNNSSTDLTINSPSTIAGNYPAVEAAFGPAVTNPITSDLILVNDATMPNPNDACEALVNGASLNGKIALIDRGDCTFVSKIQLAQNAGAIAVIMINNVGGGAITMGGTSTSITIPSVMISLNDGNAFKNAMATGTVNVTLLPSTNEDIDGDFDNGIIAHEYGHGISIRLTGGASTNACLTSAEQMGEGWSDWFGLMITIDSADLGSDIRGIGTYAINEPTNGNGIRPAPYSTDFNVNSFTYGATNNNSISQPHGLGFVFATALWDLNWALINQYGGVPDMDLYNGTGGNNVAMNLVITSLKLQPCNPGMLDGRDAILAADQLLYNGAHRCLIWDVFANRGFGFSALQGSPNNRFDQVEAFDLPPFCQLATQAPNANFNFSAGTSICETNISFTDASTNTPQNWFWDFGDGSTDSTINPSHVYSAPGTYSVKMVVSNTIGSDSIAKTVIISKPNPLVVADKDVCFGLNAVLVASNNMGTIEWYNSSNNLVSTNNFVIANNIITDKVYYVRDKISAQCISDFDTINIRVIKSDFTTNINGTTISLSDASIGASAWFWDFGDGNSSSLQNPVHTYSNAGNYNITLRLNGGPCTKTETISVISALNNQTNNDFKVYPNPAKDRLNISLIEPAKSQTYVIIENIQGSILDELIIPSGKQELEINTEKYSSSVYILRIENSTSHVVQKFIIKN